jgi:hypothetical protein
VTTALPKSGAGCRIDAGSRGQFVVPCLVVVWLSDADLAGMVEIRTAGSSAVGVLQSLSKLPAPCTEVTSATAGNWSLPPIPTNGQAGVSDGSVLNALEARLQVPPQTPPGTPDSPRTVVDAELGEPSGDKRPARPVGVSGPGAFPTHRRGLQGNEFILQLQAVSPRPVLWR